MIIGLPPRNTNDSRKLAASNSALHHQSTHELWPEAGIHSLTMLWPPLLTSGQMSKYIAVAGLAMAGVCCGGCKGSAALAYSMNGLPTMTSQLAERKATGNGVISRARGGQEEV